MQTACIFAFAYDPEDAHRVLLEDITEGLRDVPYHVEEITPERGVLVIDWAGVRRSEAKEMFES